eukprot:7998056-Pyramimonas_sp.AAC.1
MPSRATSADLPSRGGAWSIQKVTSMLLSVLLQRLQTGQMLQQLPKTAILARHTLPSFPVSSDVVDAVCCPPSASSTGLERCA